MFKRILVPLDGSKRAERILPHVEEIARMQRSEVIFLQVVQVPVVSDIYSIDPVPSEEMLKQNKMAAETYLKGLQGEFREKGIASVVRVAAGPVVDAIINAAQREKADLVAIASHGRGGVARIFYGSVAAGVLNQIDRPLLVIRSRRD